MPGGRRTRGRSLSSVVTVAYTLQARAPSVDPQLFRDRGSDRQPAGEMAWKPMPRQAGRYRHRSSGSAPRSPRSASLIMAAKKQGAPRFVPVGRQSGSIAPGTTQPGAAARSRVSRSTPDRLWRASPSSAEARGLTCRRHRREAGAGACVLDRPLLARLGPSTSRGSDVAHTPLALVCAILGCRAGRAPAFSSIRPSFNTDSRAANLERHARSPRPGRAGTCGWPELGQPQCRHRPRTPRSPPTGGCRQSRAKGGRAGRPRSSRMPDPATRRDSGRRTKKHGPRVEGHSAPAGAHSPRRRRWRR